MSRLYVVLAGQSEWQRQGRIQGSADLPLTPEGADQMRSVAGQLLAAGLNTVYSGEGETVSESGRVLAESLGSRLRAMPEFDDVDQGLWQGLHTDELQRRHPRVFRQWRDEPLTVCPPGGERIGDAYGRVAAGLEWLRRRHPSRGAAIAVVVPPLIAALIGCHLTGAGPANVWESMADQAVTVYELGGETVRRAS